jgi:hypothetical protein
LHLVGVLLLVILRCTVPWILNLKSCNVSHTFLFSHNNFSEQYAFPHFLCLYPYSALYRLGYALNDQGIVVPFPAAAASVFAFLKTCRLSLVPTWAPVHRAKGLLQSEIRRLERESHYSSSCSTEVRNAWIYTSILPYDFMISTRTTIDNFCPHMAVK